MLLSQATEALAERAGPQVSGLINGTLGNAAELIITLFAIFELAALGAASIIAALVSQDGESNWMEGTQLLAVYLILALAFYFLPTGG